VTVYQMEIPFNTATPADSGRTVDRTGGGLGIMKRRCGLRLEELEKAG